MPEAVLSALLGLFGLYVAGVTFSLQQLSDRYSPRLLPQLQRRYVWLHLFCLAVLLTLAGLLVAFKAQAWVTPMAMILFIGAVGYALYLLPQGWGLASLDTRARWLAPESLTTDAVQDMLSRLSQRRDGVALKTVLVAVRGQDDLERTVTEWYEDRPDLLSERWCGPVLIQAWMHGLNEHNAHRRQGVVIETISQRLLLPGAPGVSDLVIMIMTAVKSSRTWGDDLRNLVMALGQVLHFEPGPPGAQQLRTLSRTVQDAQEWFEIKLEHLMLAAADGTAEEAAWFADLLGELLQDLPDECLIVLARDFTERFEIAGKWSYEMAGDLLNGLDWACNWRRHQPDRYALTWNPELGEPLIVEPTLNILRAMRDVPMPENTRRHLAGKVNLQSEFRLRKYAAIGLADDDEQSGEALHAFLPLPESARNRNRVTSFLGRFRRAGEDRKD